MSKLKSIYYYFAMSLSVLYLPNVNRSYRANTISHYHLTSLFLKPLLSRPTGGTIVTISSALGYLGASHLSAYCGTKAALIAYHASLTSELQSTNPMIKTILVTSGQLSTELFGSLDQGLIRRFFGPTVEVQTLAMKIKTMVNEGRGGHIAEPGYARWISILDVLPVGVQRVVGRLAGLDSAMAGFKVKTA
jgi:short-subunit dehydrogenase